MRPAHAVRPLLLPLLAPPAAAAAEKDAPGPPPTIAQKTAGLEGHPGFLDLCWNTVQGRLFAAVRPGQQLLHQTTLTYGLGSNPVGLDRGQLGPPRLRSFARARAGPLTAQDTRH